MYQLLTDPDEVIGKTVEAVTYRSGVVFKFTDSTAIILVGKTTEYDESVTIGWPSSYDVAILNDDNGGYGLVKDGLMTEAELEALKNLLGHTGKQ